METVESVPQMRLAAQRLRSQSGGGLTLVPTMGALHPGHEALIRAAVEAGRPVVVSIVVNPLALGANENYAGYPRTPEADVALCARLGVAAVFLPQIEELFPKGFSTYVSEDAVSRLLCGVSRPNHFRGVATLGVKLLNIVRPTTLYLGQKDAQQVAVLRKVTADLNLDVEIVVEPIVREEDGLAYSVRNRDLSTLQRREASALAQALRRVKEMVEAGVLGTDRLVAEATHILSQNRRIRIIYASIVDPRTMEAVREVNPGATLMCIAAWVDEVRLTDNAVL